MGTVNRHSCSCPDASSACADGDRGDRRHHVRIAGLWFHPADLIMGVFALAWLMLIATASAGHEVLAYDDAFISFQYARNFARGLGLVFNPGERVWGFTSPLQTLMLGVLTWLGGETVRAALLTGLFWVAVISVLLYLLATQILPRGLALLLGVFFLFDYTQHGDVMFESNMLVAAQLAFLLAASKSRERMANIFGALACLVRPDALLLVLPILLFNRETRRLRNLAWFCAIGLAWECFAFFYFGELIPNSFHAKRGVSPFIPFLANAVKYATDAILAYPVSLSRGPSTIGRILVVLLGLSCLLNPGMRRRLATVHAWLLYPWLLLAAYSAIGSLHGHNWEFYSARFFVRTAAAIGFLSLGYVLATKTRMPRLLRGVATSALAIWVCANGVYQTTNLVHQLTTPDMTYWGGARTQSYRHIAEWMNQNLPQGSTIAINEVGTLAYFTEFKLIDVGGIVTRGYSANERMSYELFLARFVPGYALVRGDQVEMRIRPGLRYRRIAYFREQGFQDFSLLSVERS
jgi:arabinofuranosyltransferase